ncbi:E3 ubiquitin-protein ligase RBBP6-like [Scleropages formosus]|uniref:E3 ubiquitin-protein ligase RBBP6-like n=1 Tax=Scleropages formosus TaxID=113540 RepID=UPI000878915C|nr:E3 ubiquitin-protein ligase RBBP6-like [Scleropages formosus]
MLCAQPMEASIQETIKLPVLPEENEDPVPEELLCCICKQLMIDAALIPCCGNSYCDNCIRAALLESPKQTCPTCEQSDVSPDSLIPNKSLRLALNNFQNGKGYTRLKRKHLSSAPFTPAPKAAKIHRPAAGVPLSPLFISTAAIVPQQASGE